MEVLSPVSIFLSKLSGAYEPGQIISGRVVIATNGEEEVRGVEIKLEGKATVQWGKEKAKDNESSDEDEIDKFHNSQKSAPKNSITYLDMKNYYILGDRDGERGQILPRGESSYSFTFQLPKTVVPCNFTGKYGQIQYYIKATVLRSFWKVDYEVKKDIQMKAVTDLNKIAEAKMPGEWKASKAFGVLCCKSRPLSMNIKLDRRGYCPGDIIPMHVDVQNLSRRTVNNLTARFVQEATYVGDGSEKKFCKVLVTKKRGEVVDAGESGSWEAEVKIPTGIPPTGLGGCKIIDLKYFLKIEAHVFGVMFNLKQDCSIIIGTVPLSMEELRRDETTMTLVVDENHGGGERKNDEIYPSLSEF